MGEASESDLIGGSPLPALLGCSTQLTLIKTDMQPCSGKAIVLTFAVKAVACTRLC